MTKLPLLKCFIPIIALTGCVPMFEEYFQIARPDAKFYGTSCGGSFGAPAVAYFPHGEIWLSVMVVDYRKAVLIGLHIPAGNTVQVLDKQIKITYETSSGESITYATLAPGKEREGNPEPYSFRNFPDPYGKEDFFGVLVGDTKTRELLFGSSTADYKVYRFQADFDLNRGRKGTVTLPTIRVNGCDIPGPVLPFERRSHFEFSTINC